MSIFINTAEDGVDGSVVTTGNSGGGSGVAFDSVTPGISYSAAAAIHGLLGFFTNDATTQFVRWTTDDTTAVLYRMYFRMSDVSLGGTLLRITFATGTPSNSVALQIMTTGVIGRVQMYSGGNIGTSPNPLLADTVYRAELYVKAGAGDGEVRAAIYQGDSATPWWDSGVVGSRDIGAIDKLYAGKYVSSPSPIAFDDVAAKTGADAVWGAWPYDDPSISANAGNPIVVNPGMQFTLNGAASLGAIVSRKWTTAWPASGAPALAGSTTNAPTATAGAEGDVYVYQLEVTNEIGASSYDTVNILVTSRPATVGEDDELVWNGSSWS